NARGTDRQVDSEDLARRRVGIAEGKAIKRRSHALIDQVHRGDMQHRVGIEGQVDRLGGDATVTVVDSNGDAFVAGLVGGERGGGQQLVQLPVDVVHTARQRYRIGAVGGHATAGGRAYGHVQFLVSLRGVSIADPDRKRRQARRRADNEALGAGRQYKV